MSEETEVKTEAKTEVKTEAPAKNLFEHDKLGILNEVNITLTIEVGRATLKIKDLLDLTKDSVIELNKLAGDPVDIYANGKLISQGTIVTVNGRYCVRLMSIPEKGQL